MTTHTESVDDEIRRYRQSDLAIQNIKGATHILGRRAVTVVTIARHMGNSRFSEFQGVAICAPSDTFDPAVGYRIALRRVWRVCRAVAKAERRRLSTPS